ncbi:unnamed protein product, partial [marine sediment metagenome]
PGVAPSDFHAGSEIEAIEELIHRCSEAWDRI